MRTKEKGSKKFDAVKMMREIRDKIDKETEGMTFEQLKEYYKNSTEEIRKKSKRK